MYRISENQKCTEWPQTELEHLTVKSSLYTLKTYLWAVEAQILVRFALRLAVSEIHVQGRRKSKMHRMTPNWNWILNSQNCSIYTKYLPPEAQILVRFALWLAISEIQHVQGR